jgi:hypothetical protein
MKALSSFKIDTLVETKYFAIALNGLLILAISIWLLNQWLFKEINSSSPLLMPTAHNIQPQSQPDRATKLADMAYALSIWHLFGLVTSETETEAQLQPFITPVISEASETPIEDSNLNLALKGLLSYGDGKGLALIATTANGVHLFADEDEVLEGYTLDKVLTNHVLLRGKGRILKLALPRNLLDLRSKQQRRLESKASSDRTTEPLPLNPLSH